MSLSVEIMFRYTHSLVKQAYKFDFTGKSSSEMYITWQTNSEMSVPGSNTFGNVPMFPGTKNSEMHVPWKNKLGNLLSLKKQTRKCVFLGKTNSKMYVLL